jgi:hypothetical protein
MANTAAPNNNDFDEDLDEEFIDDFGPENHDVKKDATSAPLVANRVAKSADNAKSFINLAVIGSIVLAFVYFGYSYYKKSRTIKEQQAQFANPDSEHHADALPHTNLEPNKPLTEASSTSTAAAIAASTITPSNASNPKIQDLEFELNPNDKTLASANNKINTTKNTSSNAGILANNVNNAKPNDLEQALAPDSLKTLKPVEDIFDNDNIVDKAVTTTVAHTNDSTKGHDYVKDTLASMTEEITLNVNQIKQLELTVTQVNKTLDQLTQAIARLDHKLSDVSNALNIMDQDVNNVKKVISSQDLDLASMPNKISKNSRDPVVYSTPDYVVHAIIPGRAWLKSTGGQIITITEGDSLGDYGKVASIDATNNIVRTSSGITFR